MSDVHVIGFQMDYPNLTLELFTNDIKAYDKSIFYTIFKQAQDGYAFSKINKATKKGTSIKYKAIQNDKQAEAFEKVLYKTVDDLNKKHGLNIKLTKSEA